ncbi:Binding-protein-dependent transport systems inner membrane component [Nostocoides japonicum T1-X7]|uniref:Binding-protein-dependent transport systems inner membrane component n=1 Tax=Nostocoides japonicum T1-X7 TaxID=1194083 RepID=A0A077LYF9_9MICO|nr:ABC transporter permease [Tetrasphaera japonica]CCH77947.1 Binding-protein-dependent transport systems inner membrane component [Tetrasphaera japonica T1-X7]
MTALDPTTAQLPAQPKGGTPRSGQHTRLWAALLALPTGWMVAFFLSSMVIVVLLSFGRTQADGQPVFSTRLDNYAQLWDPLYLRLFLRSVSYAVATTAICAVLAYPVAYVVALHGGRRKNLLIAAIVVPFFASYLIRMYAWSALLSDDGLVNSLIVRLHLGGGVQFLNTPYAVIGGLVYGYVVFMILPVYAALERMDTSLIEAGKDLYHGPWRTFWSVTLPATRAGLFGGVLLVFLPALGDFVSAQLLGGPKTFMIGNLIQQQFLEGQNWPLGSAMTVAMMIGLTVIMVGYLRATATRSREAS